MRLFLLPISTKQNLIYCQRLNQQLTQKSPTFLDRVSTKAATTWLGWEKKESGWQKNITTYGNKLLQRLPYEEYGLKSIPPLSERRKSEEVKRNEEVRIEFPQGWIEAPRAQAALRRLGSDEKQAFHTKWLIGSLIGMPIVAPFALVPVIPNLPFFYLCYRAWSHWRARSGSKHLEFLLDKQLIKLCPSAVLQLAYEEVTMNNSIQQIEREVNELKTESRNDVSEKTLSEHMLLARSSGAVIAKHLEIPEIQMEIDRAVWQVERNVKAQQGRERTDKVNSTCDQSKE